MVDKNGKSMEDLRLEDLHQEGLDPRQARSDLPEVAHLLATEALHHSTEDHHREAPGYVEH